MASVFFATLNLIDFLLSALPALIEAFTGNVFYFKVLAAAVLAVQFIINRAKCRQKSDDYNN